MYPLYWGIGSPGLCQRGACMHGSRPGSACSAQRRWVLAQTPFSAPAQVYQERSGVTAEYTAVLDTYQYGDICFSATPPAGATTHASRGLPAVAQPSALVPASPSLPGCRCTCPAAFRKKVACMRLAVCHLPPTLLYFLFER